jgi:hypothetical protein
VPARRYAEQMGVVVTFTPGTSLLRERDRPSALPIVGNGPPGTFVVFPDGLRVSLPTDQVVRADAGTGSVRVEFGGMVFQGARAEGLTFSRERELWPEAQLSPARSHTIILNPGWVQSIADDDGLVLWPS